MHPVSCTNTYHDVTDLVNHGTVKNTLLRNKKNSEPVLQKTHFEKLLFGSGGNL